MDKLKAFANPFYRASSAEILLFFAGWGIWWSFFQIWLTSTQGFSGSQIGTIYSFGSAVALVLMFVYGSIQDKLGLKKYLMYFQVGCQVLLAPFFTWVYVPMLEANFYVGAMIGAIYLSVAYLAACPVFEAVTERLSRRYSFEYGQARAWGSFGYAISALSAGFLFTINPYLVFWTGSAVSLVLLLILLFVHPEKNDAVRNKYETISLLPLLKSLEYSRFLMYGKSLSLLLSAGPSTQYLTSRCSHTSLPSSLLHQRRASRLMVF